MTGRNNLKQFLENIGLSHLELNFTEEAVDFEMLLTLSEEDLKVMKIEKLGHRRTIANAIKTYKGMYNLCVIQIHR